MAKTTTHKSREGKKVHYTTVRQNSDGSGSSVKRDGNKLWGNKVLRTKKWGKDGKPR